MTSVSRLPSERVVPWLRALSAGVRAIAPHNDFVPMDAVLAHVEALSPSLSADLLAPAEVDPDSGMPSLAWMTRATAEQMLGRRAEPVSDTVHRLDPELAARMEARSRLATHLATHELLPVLRLTGRVRRVDQSTSAFVVFDHIDPAGRWVRTRVELTAPAGTRDLGLVQVEPNARIVVQSGLRDVFARHILTSLPSLHVALQGLTMARVTRVSRASLGPFWYPGGPQVTVMPAAVAKTLVLHALHEVMGDDVARTVTNDPLASVTVATAVGVHRTRLRRLAVFRPGVDAVREWLGSDVLIHPFG
jgi:hypothetical protein